MGDEPHFIARKFQDYQRFAAKKTLICSLCPARFAEERKLWDHAKNTHEELMVPHGQDEALMKRQFLENALDNTPKATKRVIRVDPPAISKPSSYDNDSILPNVGEDDKATPPIRPNSWIQSEPHGSLEHKKNSGNSGYKNDGQNLHQHTGHVAALFGRKDSPVTSSTRPEVSSKRLSSSTAPRETDPSNEPLNVKDPEYDRRISASNDNKLSRNAAGPGKRLFDPQLDDPNYNSSPARRTKNIGFNPGERRSFDGLASKRPPLVEPDSQQVTTPTVGNSPQPGLIQIGPTFPQSMKSERKSLDPRADLGPSRETELESQPELLLQPETRPISHDQLVVEVKGIYAGLVLVEAKCMDVDKKQSRAALERDPALKSKLNDEQWQALIALHKTLLHEHHDFFLASQHPSANEALSQLAERYTMPARMWRHGIHAFLEVLRHRLPDSLEHMLAFIYIAYSMIALLYETVTTFEDTWIECLGDLGRYRMAIEDDDPRDREVWGGVARFWYGKAADKCPNIGRLYHHLAILARPFSLQQLALYAKALTCVIPFGSARSSIKTLFKPVVDGKESSKHRSNSFEVVFIKAHYFLFDFNREKFVEQIKVITGGLLDQYIGRATAKFKEQGVFAAITNIAALLEYGICTEKTTPRSPIRRAFEEAEEQLQRGEAETSNTADLALDVNSPPPQPFFSSTRSVITPIQRKSSIDVILLASQITFETFSIALKRIGDKNVYPLVHVMFVFVWSLTDVPEAMEYVESDIPWGEMCSFLNALDLAEFVTKKVWAKHFPEPDNSGDHEVGRPLPEDFLLRGLMFTIRYFPQKWFANAMVDDEERNLELPSMAAPRLERILWLAARIASHEKWIRPDRESKKYGLTDYAFRLRETSEEHKQNLQNRYGSDVGDTAMADLPLPHNDAVESTQRFGSIESSGDESHVSMTLNDDKGARVPSHERDTDISMTDVEQDRYPHPSSQQSETKMHDPTRTYSGSTPLSKTTEKPASITRYLREDSDRIKSQQMTKFDLENRSTRP